MVAPDSVVELTVEDVQEGLARGRFTAAELTRAFLERSERRPWTGSTGCGVPEGLSTAYPWS
jgi:hypothetical protein